MFPAHIKAQASRNELDAMLLYVLAHDINFLISETEEDANCEEERLQYAHDFAIRQRQMGGGKVSAVVFRGRTYTFDAFAENGVERIVSKF